MPATMKKNDKQYTIRNVSPRLDQRLRENAVQYKTSLNEAALDALRRGLGTGEEPVTYHDMDDLAGTWVQDPEFDKAMVLMDRADPELWK